MKRSAPLQRKTSIRATRPKTTAQRQSAQGEQCCLQIHPYCTGSTEQTVLAHLPSYGKGMGQKSPDWWSTFACMACHDIIDSRNPQAIRDLGWAEIHACMMRGLYRTLAIKIERGLISVE